jgi:D-alanine-D-alanine ligase
VRIGIAYDLKSDFEVGADRPDDALEEYDSQATIEAIAAALRSRGHEVALMGGGRSFLERLLADAPDLVFNIAEGHSTRSREAWVPAACEMLGVPVTHADPLTCALTLDKGLAKRVAASCGVPTPAFAVVRTAGEVKDLRLRFPVIAKPLGEGSSIGIRRTSRSADVAALREDVTRLLDGYRQGVLVEEFCAGPEFTVGILGTGDGARAIGALHVRPRAGRVEDFVYSVEVKRNWREEVEYVFPPPVAPALARSIEEVALAAHRALGCRDVSRVDVRLDGASSPQFIEVNPLPGLNPETGDLCILARMAGLAYVDLVAAIVDSAVARGRAA